AIRVEEEVREIYPPKDSDDPRPPAFACLATGNQSVNLKLKMGNKSLKL
ncbi:unnamed protein product, partial [marine sediment metagenome]